MAKYPGTEVQLGTRKLVVPPIPLGMLRTGILDKMKEHDELLGKGEFYPALLIRGEIVLAALRRNYDEGELSETEFWECVDVVNVLPAWQALLGLSGLSNTGSEPGEVMAARTNGASGQSTLPSPPPTDGESGTSIN